MRSVAGGRLALGLAVVVGAGCSSSTNGTLTGTSAATSAGGTTSSTATTTSGGTTAGGSTGSNGGTAGGSSTGGCPQALCSGTCCGASDSCIGNACCPQERSCGAASGGPNTVCCSPGSECVIDSFTDAGSCEQVCQQASDCGGAAPCCAAAFAGMGGAFRGYGHCEAQGIDCLCSGFSDCSALPDGGACVPLASAGVLTGPYVCLADDGAAFHGCSAPGDPGNQCATGQACTTDAVGNQFCSTVCSSDVQCGNVGVACCAASCGSNVCCGLCGR
jgi:hypothetical protein